MIMSTVKVNQLTNWLGTRRAQKVGLWLVLSLALSPIFFREFWERLPTMLSPGWVFGQHHASPWGVLALCLVFLWLKKKEVWRGMSLSSSYPEQSKGYRLFTRLGRTITGLGLVVGAVLMPSSQDYLVFQVLLAALGIFIIFFGQAAKIPSILLTIYAFTISFPLAIQRFVEEAYSRTAITPLMGLMTTIGYPLQNEGQWLHFTSSGGEPISIAITAGCAGPATMAVFIAIFALMTLDMPLSPKKAAGFFLFGAVGTWFQSFIRLVIVILAGYYWGEHALWTAHFWTTYILFPLWYLLFAYIYFKQVKRLPKVRKNRTETHTGD